MSVKLYQGDCLEILPKLNTQISAVIADPPYGKLNKKCKWDNVINIQRMWECLKPFCKENTPIILFAQEPYTSMLIVSNIKMFKYKLFWHKTTLNGYLNAKRQPLRCIEEILVFYKKQCTYNPQKSMGHKPMNSYRKRVEISNNTVCYGKTTKEISGGGSVERYPTQVLTFKSDKQTMNLHPTQKPLSLMEYLIKTYTNEGDTVLDFCMGSGTTGKACQNLNRDFIGIELGEVNFQIAQTRLMKGCINEGN